MFWSQPISRTYSFTLVEQADDSKHAVAAAADGEAAVLEEQAGMHMRDIATESHAQAELHAHVRLTTQMHVDDGRHVVVTASASMQMTSKADTKVDVCNIESNQSSSLAIGRDTIGELFAPCEGSRHTLSAQPESRDTDAARHAFLCII